MFPIRIDGTSFTAGERDTILDACRTHGVAIPTLCHLDGVSSAASCRVCLVEVRGLPRPVPACATTVWPGMEITTASEELRAHRRAVVEMLFAGGHHVCAYCPASGGCELQELARSLGLEHVASRVVRPAPRLDASHPRFALDPGRCVLCTRCVRVCSELEHAGTLLVLGRGRRARLATDGRGAWAGSPTCTACGRCIAACPTGALFEKDRAAQGLSPSRAPARAPAARIATLALGGCAGCHMSLLDLDADLLGLAGLATLVASPLGDEVELPCEVDVCLVEGACSTDDDVRRLRAARERTRVLVALGDCAGSGNVTAMRDAVGGAARALAVAGEGTRHAGLPALLDRVLTVEEVVPVDRFLPGCPPPAPEVLRVLLAGIGRTPPAAGQAGRFG